MARRTALPTILLSAYGLGLMICSPTAVRALEAGSIGTRFRLERIV
jgi:hypothetical protein